MKTALLALLIALALAQDNTVLYPADPIFVPLGSPLLGNGNANQNGVDHSCSDGSRSCRPDQKWDPSTRTCVVKCIQNVMCTLNHTWDPVQCTCVCVHQKDDCDWGYHWNNNLCECEQNHLSTSN